MQTPCLLLLLGLVGCQRTPALDTFIALPEDFAGFADWTSFNPNEDGHGGVPQVVYANDYALSEPDRFPTGSVIVKVATVLGGAITHAMARRGDGYNAEGAVGWEWFELDHIDAEVPRIAWRGEAPPDGEHYALFAGDETGGEGVGDCNVCHAAAADNQYVFTVKLQ